MVTLVIMGILALMAVPMAQVAIQRDKERELRGVLIELREAIDAYKRAADQGRIMVKVGESGYPKTLNELVDGVPDQQNPKKQMLYFLRRLPRDPLHPNLAIAAEQTWGKRSYQSPPNEPAEGDDVFDVYSLSDKTGLNGIAYRKW